MICGKSWMLARWAPTAHNMQNFDVIVVDDKEVLEIIGNVKSRISEVFLRENYEQLSFSKEELLKKKTGILGAMFPPAWVDPSKMAEAARESAPMPLTQSISGSPCLLIVVYDPKKRAPASEGDVLGFMSLGLRDGEHVAYGSITGNQLADSECFRGATSGKRA